MDSRRFIEAVESTSIIAAVKDDEGLEKALRSDTEIIFVLYGDICSIASITHRIRQAGKIAMIHVDLISGLSTREIILDYISESTEADGIITTKHSLIPHARELGLYTVLRFFALDSTALTNIGKAMKPGVVLPDVIEFLPGIISARMIEKINEASRVPVIAGGLITDKTDVMNALKGGAVAISTTNQDVWFL